MNKIICALFFMVMLSSCFSESNPLLKHADKKFADQEFKTAISLIELHNIRYGEYPENLDSLKFVGAWAMLSQVEYIKLEEGYELNMPKSLFTNSPISFDYPDDFWNGLGLVKTNVRE